MSRLYLAQVHAADDLLAADPLALIVGMLLDQQITATSKMPASGGNS